MATVRALLLVAACLLALLPRPAYQAENYPKVEAYFQGHCTELSPCHQRCIDLPFGGYECACWKGFKLHSNGFSCIDDNGSGASSKENIKSKSAVPKNGNPPAELPPQMPPDPSWDDLEAKLPWPVSANPLDMMMGDDPMLYETNHIKDDDDSDNIKRQADEASQEETHRGKGQRRGKGRRRRKNKDRRKGHNREAPLSDSVPSDLGHNPDEDPDAFEDEEEENNNIYENTKPPIRFHSCEELRCHARGQCVPDELRGGFRCQCQLGNGGEFCEQDIVVQYPKFMGTGYMAFPVLRGAYKEFSITIEFRPDTDNGLLLFSGAHPTARSDFFAISLVNGHAELRFDCGTGLGQITTGNVVKRGEWNRIVVNRNDFNGWIQLNDGNKAKGRSRGIYTRITFREDLYLGGFRNLSLLGSRVGMLWGFVGCIRYLEVNNRVYDMRKGAFVGDAIHGVDVGECSSRVCSTVKCHNGGTCVADSPDTHVCMCPLGTAGDHCENRIDIHVPSFAGNSYLQYIGLRRTVLSFAEIEIVFKAESPTGLLLYNGYTTDRSGDFISVALVDQYLEYRFDLGTGPAVMKSREKVSLREWHVVRVSRTGRDGQMQIDDKPSVEGMSKGAYTQLTLTLDLFIGGHRNFDEVAKHANIRESFKGCIQKVVINERPTRLLEEAINGVNIDNCQHPCVGQPCRNGGRCVPIRDFYKCSCPLGFENTNCEDQLNEPIRIPRFTSDSYLMYTDPYILQRVRGKKIEISMRIRANERASGENGLLFWTGEEHMTSSSDYLALGLIDGHIQFGFNLGSGEVVIIYNQTRVNDGKWHKIHAQRYEKVGVLEIDGTEVIEGTSPGNLKQLNTHNRIFVGGMEDIVHRTNKKYNRGFDGCISNITLATDYHIDILGQASEGQNIQQCT